MVRDSNEGRIEKHERIPWLRPPAILGSMKARPRAASADVTLASSSIHGAEYVQQANVRRSHMRSSSQGPASALRFNYYTSQRAASDQIFGPKPEKRLVDSHKIDVIQQKKVQHAIIFSNSFVRRSTGQMQMK